MDDPIFLFVSVSSSMHEIKSGMVKEYSTVKEVFSLDGQMEKLWRKIYFGKPDTGNKIKN